jgi:hypothetical protein
MVSEEDGFNRPNPHVVCFRRHRPGNRGIIGRIGQHEELARRSRCVDQKCEGMEERSRFPASRVGATSVGFRQSDAGTKVDRELLVEQVACARVFGNFLRDWRGRRDSNPDYLVRSSNEPDSRNGASCFADRKLLIFSNMFAGRPLQSRPLV